MSDSIKELTTEIRDFSDARNWYKNGRVDLKGLAISISLEAAELLEHFQWVKDEKISANSRTSVSTRFSSRTGWGLIWERR